MPPFENRSALYSIPPSVTLLPPAFIAYTKAASSLIPLELLEELEVLDVLELEELELLEDVELELLEVLELPAPHPPRVNAAMSRALSGFIWWGLKS